ncbi:MAG: hypothetical protein WCS77_00060 [Elusimicrobiaceae bacterium]
MIRDTEELLLAIRDVLVDSLNARIVAINTEKGDSALDQVPCATAQNIADHFRFSISELPNKDPFVNIALEKLRSDANGDCSAVMATVVVELVFRDKNKGNEYLKSLRYTRAIKEALESQALELGLTLEELIPVTVDTGGVSILVGGVKASISFA